MTNMNGKRFAACAVHRQILTDDSPDLVLWVEGDSWAAGLAGGATLADCPDTYIGIVRVGRPGDEPNTYVARTDLAGREIDVERPIARIFDYKQGGPVLRRTVQALDRKLSPDA